VGAHVESSDMAKSKPPFVSLARLVATQHPSVDDPEESIRSGLVHVDGAILTNPAARVRRDAAIQVGQPLTLQGAKKLAAAIDHFRVVPEGRKALDLGASTGGFTSVLLERGAAVVYAVDAGYGQLLGSIRQDPRVRNLERTNLGDLTVDLVPDEIDIVTMDLSYLAIADAITQVEAVRLAEDADLVALVKPQYELGLAALPAEPDQLQAAVGHARDGVERLPWKVTGVIDSPVRGGRGAVEFLLHASRSPR
jgi:23S rRNA (cytidine1920-2'-O)/16S rRNA (cytidine1409-2'-O)-methyltransferase